MSKQDVQGSEPAREGAVADDKGAADAVGDPGPGCRPCCSTPHGFLSVLAGIFATIALVFSYSALNSCHFMTSNFMYCHPPPAPSPPYAFCGDCHCIYDADAGETCPTGDEVPPMDTSDSTLQQYKSLTITNPYQMLCNPYNTTDRNCTDPPQSPDQIGLWEDAACGIKYDMSTLDPDDQCPTQYSVHSYDSEADMLADNASMTHWGACGVCSTLRDLAVYIEHPDLTTKGVECSLRGIADFEDGVACYQEVGYTRPCAEMWIYNGYNTRDKCLDVCLEFRLTQEPSNGPPPACRIADCLLCDEQMSGPFFQTVAARSRRRSGLLSKIARPCSVILIVDHEPPCNTTQRAVAETETTRLLQGSDNVNMIEAATELAATASEVLQSTLVSQTTTAVRANTRGSSKNRQLEAPVAPEYWKPPPPTETCIQINDDLGLTRYAGYESNNWFDDDLFLDTDSKYYTTQYSTCFRYEIRRAVQGYWANMSTELGSAHKAAMAFGILAVVIGTIICIFTWSAACIAYPRAFWTWMGYLYAACGIFDFLTLVFFASDVCEKGCLFGYAAGAAIVAGVFYIAAAVASWATGPYQVGLKSVACCCCPAASSTQDAVVSTSQGERAHLVAPTGVLATGTAPKKQTVVSITETVGKDGNKVTEKVTTHPDGSQSVETITTKYKGEAKASMEGKEIS